MLNVTDLEFYDRDIRKGNLIEDFSFFTPIEKEDLEKSLKSDDRNDPYSWKVAGYAASSDTDLENESIVPSGLDFDYFIRFGFFNWNHSKDPGANIGIPTEAYVDSKGFYTKGYLMKEMPQAQECYQLMKAFATGNYPRQMGFSVEGKVVKQEGNKIIKAWLKAVAITSSPVNTKTYAQLVKSFSACDVSLKNNKIFCHCKDENQEKKVLKALSAGYQVSDQTGGDALRVQDLEKKLKILTNKEGLSEDELREYIKMKAGYSPEATEKLIKYIKLLKRIPTEKSFYPSAPATIV